MTRDMNVLSLSRAIGATVLVTFPLASGSVAFYRTVKDVRKVYNRIDLLVSPESGSGEGWVSLERVERTGSGVCAFSQALTV